MTRRPEILGISGIVAHTETAVTELELSVSIARESRNLNLRLGNGTVIEKHRLYPRRFIPKKKEADVDGTAISKMVYLKPARSNA